MTVKRVIIYLNLEINLYVYCNSPLSFRSYYIYHMKNIFCVSLR